MQYGIFLLLFLFLIFLFILFAFCRDDFVLFRKNVDMEKVFNLAFLIGITGLFFSRFFYVLLYFNSLYLNPLAFVLFPYFPGLSLPGGLLGGSLGLAFLLRGKKYPEGRLFDFFILAFSLTLIIDQLLVFGGEYLLIKQFMSVLLANAVVIFSFFLLSYRVFKQHGLKEGSVGLALVFFISIVSIVSILFPKHSTMLYVYKEVSVWSIVCLLSLFFFLRQESPVSFLKFFGKK